MLGLPPRLERSRETSGHIYIINMVQVSRPYQTHTPRFERSREASRNFCIVIMVQVSRFPQNQVPIPITPNINLSILGSFYLLFYLSFF